jgi:hypothetical protein
MADPIFPDVSGTIEFSFFPVAIEEVWNPIRTAFESGHVAVRPRHTMRRRRIRWSCPVLDPPDLQKIMGFLTDRKGGGNWFFIQNRDPIFIWPPYDVPNLATVGGGSLGSRTYFVVIAYANADGTLVTTASLEDSQLVPASSYLRITMPDFPPNVDRANIYIGTSTGVVYYSGYSATPLGIWDETDAATTVNADSGVGTDIIFVASTTNFKIGDTIRLDDAGARQEDQIILDILAGPARLQIEGTLGFTHTGAQADPVETKVGLSTQAAPATENNFQPELIKVVLVNEPTPVLRSATVWSLTLEMEEILP